LNFKKFNATYDLDRHERFGMHVPLFYLYYVQDRKLNSNEEINMDE